MRSTNPYVGPRPFQPGEKLYGRDDEIYDLLDLLIAERIVLLYSPSGAGKTSLIQAGLLPELVEEGFQALPVMRVSLEPSRELLAGLPHNRYILSLLLSLEQDVPTARQVPLPDLTRMTLAEYLERRTSGPARDDQEAAHTAEPSKIVLLFDQFEEIITINPTDHDAKVEFFTQVGAALRHRDYWALFSMREEFPARLDPYVRHVPTRMTNRFRLELLDVASAIAAIQEPAQDIDVTFTANATTKLVDDLRRVRIQQPDGMIEERPGIYVEPVQLQVVCYRLWNHLPEDITEIREADIRAAGDVDTALAGYYAERVHEIAAQTGVTERTIREWFLHHLITDQGIRGQIVKEAHETQGLANAAIEELVDAHLVRAEQRRGVTWYELAHDRLIEPVQLDNFDWLQEHLSTLQREAALWELQERASGLLLLDDALKNVEQWAADHAEDLIETEQEFLEACRAEQERVHRERLKSRFIRGLAVAATIVMCIAIFFYFDAEGRRRDAQRLNYVSQAQNLMNEATQQRHTDLKLLLLRQAYLFNQQGRGSSTARLDELLRQELHASQFSRVRYTGSESMAVAVSADGRYLACGLGNGTIQVIDLQTPAHAPVVLTGHRGPVCALAFHPDKPLLASGGWDQVIRLWEAPFSSAESVPMHGHAQAVFSLDFSPDGTLLASGSWDATVRLWDLRTPHQSIHILRGHEGGVNAVAFHPSGSRLASGGADRTIRLWNMADLDHAPEMLPSQPSETLNPHSRVLPAEGRNRQTPPNAESGSQPFALAGINTLAFSPDGTNLAVGTTNSTILLWDMLHPARPPERLAGHRQQVLSVAFSPDGTTLASGSNDHDIRLWNLADPTEPSTMLRGHNEAVFTVAYHPSGSILASGSDDGTLCIWEFQASETSFIELTMPAGRDNADAEGGDPFSDLSESQRVEFLAFTPDGQQLRAVHSDVAIASWRLTDTRSVTRLVRTLPRKVSAFALNPDATYLVAGDESGSLQIMKADSSEIFTQQGGTSSHVLHETVFTESHTGKVSALAFHADGTLLASGGDDRIIRIWKIDTPQAPTLEHVLRGHENSITALAFSPTLPILVSGGSDSTVRLWNIEFSNYPPLVLGGHSDTVNALAFSPDGKLLASADESSGVRLWQLHAMRTDAVWLLQSSFSSQSIYHGEDVMALAFSHDGTTLAIKTKRGIYLLAMQNLQASPVVLAAPATPPPPADASAPAAAAASSEFSGEQPPARAPENDENAPIRLSPALAFSPDDHVLASGAQSTDVTLWTLTEPLYDEVCQRVWRNLSPQEWQQFVGKGMPHERTCPDLP